MSDIPPKFKSGNGFFINALNAVVDYARGHGINTAGLPGWSWTPDGWVPPLSGSGAGDEGLKPWDLTPHPDGDFVLYAPKAFIDSEDITSEASITNTAFAPVAGEYLVAEIDDLTTLDITIDVKSTWTSYPSAYDFDSSSPYAFSSANIPLWRFYDADGDGRVEITSGIYGEKIVASRPLYVRDQLVIVPGESLSRSVPYFD